MSAHKALRQRRKDLVRQVQNATSYRDRYQDLVNQQQKYINQATAEIASVDSALAVLDAAAEYNPTPTTKETSE
jgi:hypothetical protein